MFKIEQLEKGSENISGADTEGVDRTFDPLADCSSGSCYVVLRQAAV